MVEDNASHANMDLVWACDKGAEGELLRRKKGPVTGRRDGPE